MGFVGAHPDGLANLARLADRRSRLIGCVARTVDGLLGGDADRTAGEAIRLLLEIAASLAEAAGALERRAATIRSARDVAVPGPVGHRWYLTNDAGHRPVDPVTLPAMPPHRVATALSSLAPAVAMGLVADHPALVGNLDGAPPRLRYEANRILIQRQVALLEAELLRLGGIAPARWVDWMTPRWLSDTFPQLADAAATADRLRHQLEEYRQWLAEDRQILLFDPSGDGRVVEVFGDLDRAHRIAVVVPGIMNDLAGFSSADEGGLRGNAAVLYEAAAALDSDVATIAWLGYDTPDGIDAALRRAADVGATALRHFIAGIDPHGDARVTVVAHSYGSLVAGLAAAEGLAADDLVFVGSPGTGLKNAAAARLRPGGQVWVGLADGDPVAAALHPSRLSPWWPPNPAPTPVLWHGANPAAAAFGAERFATEAAQGHSAYFEAGSLENLTRIMLGRYTEVDLLE